jgi:hypothetical protein
METCSSLFTIAVFLLGATCGGLLVTIQRQARMDRTKAMFAEELHQMCERSYAEFSGSSGASEVVRITEMTDPVAVGEASTDMDEDPQTEWLHDPVAQPRGNEHHVRG